MLNVKLYKHLYLKKIKYRPYARICKLLPKDHRKIRIRMSYEMQNKQTSKTLEKAWIIRTFCEISPRMYYANFCIYLCIF